LGVFALNPETVYDSRMPKDLAPDCEQIYLYSVYGGVGQLVDALVRKIQAQTGIIHTSRAVTKIIVENNNVTGVVDELGVSTPADVVMASGGARETFLKLVGEENLPADFIAHVKQIPLMDSIFMVHLGVDLNPSKYVRGVCTYFYGTYDIEGGVEGAHSGLYHEGRLGFVVHVPSLYSPQMAPEGRHALTIYTICPDRLKDGSWSERKEEFADRLVAYAEKYIPGLREHTLVRVVLTPEDFRKRTHLDHHAFGGIAPLMGAWKAPHQAPVNGLWFVGAQSESGGGVSAVMVAAYKAAKKAGKEFATKAARSTL
jgi:phytoene dehydrogenase-like protein